MTVRERLNDVKQKDYITVEECALLVGCSERTIWRRLPTLPLVIRTGRVTRVHRLSALRALLRAVPVRATE